ncbi:UNKNOWN [Stylonychia lemnae]|uniref:Uncharacterized protein n=1 Tax=Stylonychia lemnae TaxID=5949 RepID=A0A077ZRL5_STYLE|nr:UNKNOWN [Stylonychia lemnae]|eukprot:CDW72522.1 UNKNOWN [Stylonychia lemnae]
MTHNLDGLKRTKSYSTKLAPFYCYVEEYYLKECETKKLQPCDDKLIERNECHKKVEGLEENIRFACWTELADQYDCVKVYLDQDGKVKPDPKQNTEQNQSRCYTENENAFKCIKKVVKPESDNNK